ncbi:MAG: O-linked GlcNAc transferase, partial [Candidatus Kaiserbacteria bacterium GW2011_GWA1_50_28]
FYSGVGFIPTSFVTVGLLGVVAWGAVILALLMSVLSLMRRRAESSKANVTLSLLVGAAVYLTAYHVLYVPGPALSALTFMFFGFLVAGELLTGSVRERVWAPSLDPWKYYVSVGVLTVFALLILFGGLQFARTLVSGMLVNRSVTIYNSTQNIENASRSVNTALKVLPANDRAHRAAIELGLLQLKQLIILTSTIQHGLTAVSIESTNYQNWLSLARLYGELAGVGVEGAEERARSAYEEARKSSTTNPYPLLALAQLDLLKKDESSARANLLSALELKPNLAMALFLLSQIDARAGNLAEAAKSAEEVVRVVPEDPLGWYNLGTIYYVSGKYENSTAALGRAVGLKNDYANALFLLSASYAALERFDDARTALREVIALNPSVTSLPEMLARLEKGENPFAPSDNNAVDQ